MEAAAIDSARRTREALTRDGPRPEAFRAALEAVPARDRDAWLDLVWDVGELPDDDPGLPRNCVPYLPCPAATVLDALEQAAVTRDDVFVDIGAGLGRTIALAHLLTGAGCVGLEIQRGLVEAARARADWLGLTRARFVEGDAAELVRWMTVGTVFFLYCPFSGARLERVLDALEELAGARALRVCCVDLPPLQRPWLAPLRSRSAELAVYRSTRSVARRPPARVDATATATADRGE